MPSADKSKLVQQVRTAIDTARRFEETRTFFRQLYGDRWPVKSEPYRKIIFGKSSDTGKDTLSTAIELAKELSAAGHDPSMLLAVACDMIREESGNPSDAVLAHPVNPVNPV